jgi:hypothetical protein
MRLIADPALERRRALRARAALFACCALVVAGCGGSDAPAAPAQPPATAAPAPAPAPGPSPAPTPPPPPPAGADTSAPTVPTSVVVTAQSAVAARVTWSASSDNVGVTGYRILRDGSAVGTSTSTSFSDNGLTPGAQYVYAVLAFDAAGNTSPASAGMRVTMPATGGAVVQANPGNYLSLLSTLRPGDTMVLASGTYDNPSSVPGLPLFDINGAPGNPIVITGPTSGAPAVFLGRSTHNTVRLSNASHLVLRNFEIDGRNQGAAGIAAQGLAHNITIENLRITGVGDDQQTVGISTVGSTVWNWVIRRNVIEGAGTGIYFGNSDGRSPFIAGLIENNLIRDTIGYNMQIKHQLPRPTNIAGMPTSPQKTIIRNNVFSKSANSSTGALARPNLLVGHFPTSGPGMDDQYEIYGNFFWQNPTEALFQGEGNVAFYGNVMVNDSGSAVNIQPHLDVPRYVRVFGNTVVASGTGIRVTGGATSSTQRVFGNAVFAATPLSVSGAAAAQSDNSTDSYANAVNHLIAPRGTLGAVDLYPRAGMLTGAAWNAPELSGFAGAGVDFNGAARSFTRRGAYSGEASNPGWRLALDRKP